VCAWLFVTALVCRGVHAYEPGVGGVVLVRVQEWMGLGVVRGNSHSAPRSTAESCLDFLLMCARVQQVAFFPTPWPLQALSTLP